MTVQLDYRENPDYTHVVVSGPKTRENIERYLADLLEACQERGCRRLLIEERLVGPRLQMMEIFQIVTNQCVAAIGKFDAIALVDFYDEGNLTKFAETVAVNRALPLAVFDTVEQAERWLSGFSK